MYASDTVCFHCQQAVEKYLKGFLENKGKYKYAKQHFETLNQQQTECTYFFHFLTPRDYDKFFKFLRDGNYASFVSEVDAALEGNDQFS